MLQSLHQGSTSGCALVANALLSCPEGPILGHGAFRVSLTGHGLDTNMQAYLFLPCNSFKWMYSSVGLLTQLVSPVAPSLAVLLVAFKESMPGCSLDASIL